MTRKLRIIIPILVLVLAGVGFVLHTGFGSVSAIGFSSISILCPIGSLLTMISSKTLIPRALLSLVIAIIAVVILGRAFCAWICPVPIWKKWRTILHPKAKDDDVNSEQSKNSSSSMANTTVDSPQENAANAQGQQDADEGQQGGTGKQVVNGQQQGSNKKKKRICACQEDEKPSNARHFILGGSLLSAAIFGFPVFCLICPVGLSFALIFILIALFGNGDVTWSVIVIPVLIILEVVVFRKWCSHICPISAFMSIVGRLNHTFRPKVKTEKCAEKNGHVCGKCSQVCEVGIDPRHLERGAAMYECTKCRECVISCPAHAISMPFIAKKTKAEQDEYDIYQVQTSATQTDEAQESDASKAQTNEVKASKAQSSKAQE